MIEPAQELLLTRLFDAPRELVFAACTESEHLTQWFGPHGFSVSRCVSEPRPGGRLEIDMRNVADGLTYPMTGEYLEVDPPNRFVTFTFGRLDGGARNTFTFTDVGGKTELTLHVQSLKPHATDVVRSFREAMKAGLMQSYEKLDGYLASAA